MKKYFLLTILLLASCRSFSQNDTLPKQAVKLIDPVARFVIKDLITGDACKLELDETRKTLKLTERKSEAQQRIIVNMEAQTVAASEIIVLKDEQIASQINIITATEKQLRRQKTSSWIYKVGTVVGILSTGYLLIAK